MAWGGRHYVLTFNEMLPLSLTSSLTLHIIYFRSARDYRVSIGGHWTGVMRLVIHGT